MSAPLLRPITAWRRSQGNQAAGQRRSLRRRFCRRPHVRRCLIVLTGIAFGPGLHSAAAQDLDSLTRPYPDSSCPSCADWNAPQKPFRIHHDTYYVGTHGLAAILITSPAGHVLIDGALPNSAPILIENIRSLGFEPTDIRLILNSHAHFDHAGGIAAIRRLSGARVVASPANASVLERGRSGPDDPQYGVHLDFPAVAEVERIEPGATLRVGTIEITAHATAGHTPGGTSWSWQSCENGSCVDVVYADSQTPVSAEGFRFTDSQTYPTALADFEHGFQTLERLPCDILVTTHPGASSLWERVSKGRAGLVDSQACQRYAAAARTRLAERVIKEAGDSERETQQSGKKDRPGRDPR